MDFDVVTDPYQRPSSHQNDYPYTAVWESSSAKISILELKVHRLVSISLIKSISPIHKKKII